MPHVEDYRDSDAGKNLFNSFGCGYTPKQSIFELMINAIALVFHVQPKNGSVEINPDGQSARFIKNSMETIEELGVQEFSYEVQMFPNNSKSVSVVHSAMIYVVEEQDCFNGKPVEYEELKPTDERLVKRHCSELS